MEIAGKRVLVCDCTGTMPLDGKALRKACSAAVGTDVGEVEPATILCRTQIGIFEDALKSGRELVVACTQEAPCFAETRAETGLDNDIRFVNIRERAGWSEEAGRAMPKIAALLAEAAIDIPPPPVVTMRSQGAALVYGRDEMAIEAARRLGERLDCTILLVKPASVAPARVTDVPIFKGTIVRASGHIGAFQIVVDDYAPSVPSARGQLGFELARDGVATTCDVILDLTGGAPLFRSSDRRDGYFRPDPKDIASVERAIFEIAELVGDFEKPKYVTHHPEICAYRRGADTGCTRCLDICPVGAVAPAGDKVEFDAFVCAGCGACTSVCPTGAAAFTVPETGVLLARLRVLLSAYRLAGGERPLLLVHDARHGEEMIDLIARHGRGLPANVLPFAVGEITQIGLDLLVSAFANGASLVRFLADPGRRDEHAGLAGQIGLAQSCLAGLGYGEGRVALIDSGDPEAVEAELYGTRPPEAPTIGNAPVTGGKRGTTMQALRHLHSVAPAPVDVLPTAKGSPFGTVSVDPASCTVCFSCTVACPTAALRASACGKSLHLIADDCIQCGLCRTACPESAIELVPQIDFTPEAASARVVISRAPA